MVAADTRAHSSLTSQWITVLAHKGY